MDALPLSNTLSLDNVLVLLKTFVKDNECHEVAQAFGEINFDEDKTAWIPQTETEISAEGLKQFNNFRDKLDEDEDVQELWHNVKNA